MSHGVFSLFGVTKSGSVNAAQSISQALHMPFITPSLARGTADDEYQYEINMYPSYIEAIIDIINYHKWGKVYYVYDSDDGEFLCIVEYKNVDFFCCSPAVLISTKRGGGQCRDSFSKYPITPEPRETCITNKAEPFFQYTISSTPIKQLV